MTPTLAITGLRVVSEANELRFFVPGVVKGQPRPRAFSFNGQARVYDPGTAEGWKSSIAVAARACLPSAPIDGPVSIEAEFIMPRPKSHFGKRGLKASAPHWHVSKPDIDNALKGTLDACTALGFWRDDAQVCAVTASRRYFDPAMEQPGAWITIRPLRPLDSPTGAVTLPLLSQGRVSHVHTSTVNPRRPDATGIPHGTPFGQPSDAAGACALGVKRGGARTAPGVRHG